MILHLSCQSFGIDLRLPVADVDVKRTLSALRADLEPAAPVRISGVCGNAYSLHRYIQNADLENGNDLKKLNQLAELFDGIGAERQHVLSEALDTESINGLDDVLCVASSITQYEFIEGVTSDKELGGWLVEHGLAGVDFPKDTRPYLDYSEIGAKYCSEHGGTYTANGYLRYREGFPALDTGEPFTIRLILTTSKDTFPLSLPAADERLELAKRALRVDDFAQASISGIQFSNPTLADLIPADSISVEDANELAAWLQQMEQEDGEMAKYCAVLEVEQPDTFSQALTIAMDADDYELVPEDMDEYGKQVLRRIGADEELLDTIDGYMNFAQLGEDFMQEDGVRRTEFGLVRRLSAPYPQPQEGLGLEMR